MKTSLTLLLLTSGAVFAEPSIPEFSAKIDVAPSLSLTDSIKAGLLSQDRSNRVPSALPVFSSTTAPRRIVSHMPVIEPIDSVAQNMPVVKPDSTVVYSMIVKEPEVVSAK